MFNPTNKTPIATKTTSDANSTTPPQTKKLSEGKILLIILAIILLGCTGLIIGALLLQNNNNSDIQYSSTSDLHINMDNWSYDSNSNTYYQVGLVYASQPVDKSYESAGIFVPGQYLNCTQNGDKYSCTKNTVNQVANYTADTAPIVMPINTPGYSAQSAPSGYSQKASTYTAAGYIYLEAGARGRANAGGPGGNTSTSTSTVNGSAPWGVTDFKAAIRYFRYNANSLPGNTNAIYAFGHSGGGAQSSILGASGNSTLYDNYLRQIGALMTDDSGNQLSDAINGVMAWCPITNLDVADAAYEWNLGQYTTSGTRAPSTWTSALSADLAQEFAHYVNSIQLKHNDTTLTLTASTDGIYTSGNYYDYLKSTIEESLTHYLNDNFTNTSDMQSYADKYSWITFNTNTKSATITSVSDFVKTFKTPSKDVGAFDDLKRKQAENYVFGDSNSNPLHFDAIISNLLKTKDYSSYSDYSSDYANAYQSDLTVTDSLGKDSTTRQNMYNPMYYLNHYYDGYQSSTVAPNWRIRTGITQGDTANVTEMNLALALQNYGGINVDFATIWAKGHTEAERTGTASANFIEWVNQINQ